MLKRCIIGVLLAGVLIAMLYLGNIMRAVLFTIGALVAVHEMLATFKKKGYSPFALPSYCLAAAFALWGFFFPGLSFVYLLALCAMLIMVEFLLNKSRTLEDCFFALVVLVYPVAFLIMLFQLGMEFADGLGTTALLAAFACPLMGDTFAYFIGSLFGRHKLCPSISPKKTVEGGVASLLGSMSGAVLVYFLQCIWGSATAPIWLFVMIGFFCGIFGQLGDLFASALKRWAEIKDFGRLFPGHGGMMDRIDSVLFCAPMIHIALFLYIKFL